MKKNTIVCILAVGLYGLGLNAAPDFKKDVLPIIQERCIECHGEPYLKRGRLRKPKGDYRMDSREHAIKAGDSEVAGIVPGKPDASEVIKRVVLPEDHDDIMPPKGDPLTAEQIKVLKDWIAAGAPWTAGVVIKRPPEG